MMPPHDKSADSTSYAPSNPMYCSPIGGSGNNVQSVTNKLNGSRPPSSGESPPSVPKVPPTMMSDNGGMFCAPITAAPPPPIPTIKNGNNTNNGGNLSPSAPPPPPTMNGMFCGPINGSFAPPPPPPLPTLITPTKTTKGEILTTADSKGTKTPETISPPPLMMTNPAGMGGAQLSAAYHPDYMFCGTCTTCLPQDQTRKKTTMGVEQQSKENLDDYLIVKNKIFNADDDSSSDEEECRSSSALHQTILQITDFPPNSSKSILAHGLLLQSLLQPLVGVKSVSFDQAKAAKQNIDPNSICIDHTLQTSQAQLMAALKRGGYTSMLVVVEESLPTSSSSSQSAIPPTRLFESTDDGTNNSSSTSSSLSSSTQQTIVRSQFHVGGICCAMEIPAIRKIVKPMFGVETLQVNITTKMVYVQHDARCVSAEAIVQSLTKEGFPSEVRVDGAAQLLAQQQQQQRQQQQNQQSARTRLKVQTTRALREDELNLIRQQLEQVPGIDRVDIVLNKSSEDSVVDDEEETNCILVEHDCDIIEAKSIPPLVQGWDLNVINTAQIQFEDGTSPSVRKSDFVESTLVVEQLQHRNIETLQSIFRQNYIKAQVRAFFAHVPSHTVKVEHNPALLDIHDIPKLLEPYGLNAHVAVDGKEAGLVLPDLEEYDGQYHANEGMVDTQIDSTSNLKWNVILSGIFWVLSMLSPIGGIMSYFAYFGLLSVFFGLPPVARKAWRTARRRQFDSNCMMVTAALGALLLGEFDEAASVAFLFSVSEFLEARSTSKARKALEAIVQLRPDHASVIHPTTKEITIVPASQVPVGSLLSVRTGDKIAADGVVVEGISTVDESSLTGESKPIMKRKDDVVSGGTINVGTTQLVVKTTSSVEDSVVSRLIKVVEDAQSCRSKTEKMIDKFAKSYTPFVVCMAGIMCTLPWLWGHDIGRYWTLNGLIIIVISCPCSLTISTPVTYAAGLAATAQRGIIVKGGAHLEALGAVETVVMDKTGTISHGQFHVNHLKEIGNARTRKEMLELLALMEAPSSHPLSETLVRAARKEGVSIPRDAEVELHTVLKGEGVTAKVNGKQVYVGNKRLFDRVGMYSGMPVVDKDFSNQWADDGATVGFIGVDGEGIIGAFSMIDTIRDETHDTIESLKSSNINVVMLTGDGDGAAQAVARQVGISPSSVHSQLLPEDKLHFVGSLIRPEPSGCGPCKAKSKVLFIGDGINDTPALAVADVGVSMGDGAAALAMEVSDVTLMDSNLSKLLYVIQMGGRVVNTIQENIAFSLLSKLLVVGLTFAGKMTLFGAIASDVGVMLMVTLNGMKLLPVSSDVDVEPTAKRRIRSPKLSSYNKISSDDFDGGVELGEVNKELPGEESEYAGIV